MIRSPLPAARFGKVTVYQPDPAERLSSSGRAYRDYTYVTDYNPWVVCLRRMAPDTAPNDALQMVSLLVTDEPDPDAPPGSSNDLQVLEEILDQSVVLPEGTQKAQTNRALYQQLREQHLPEEQRQKPVAFVNATLSYKADFSNPGSIDLHLVSGPQLEALKRLAKKGGYTLRENIDYLA